MSQFGNPISGHLIKCLFLPFDGIVSMRLCALDNSYLIQWRKIKGRDSVQPVKKLTKISSNKKK